MFKIHSHGSFPLQILVLVALLIPAMMLCAEPAQVDIETGKLHELRASIDALKKDLDAVRGEHDTQQQILEKSDKAIGDIHREIRRLERDAVDADLKLDRFEQQRSEANARLDAIRSILERELRAAWMGGRQERIKLLLSQEEPASIGRMLAYQGYFARARAKRMDVYNDSLQALQNASQEVRDQQARIVTLQEQQQQQAARLAAEQETQHKLVAALQEKLQSGNVQLAKLQQDEQRVNQLVQSLQEAMRDIPPVSGSQQGLHHLKGQLHWPVAGRISVPFGARQASGQMTSRGVHISAQTGTEVRAVAQGRVVFADWLRGFGLLLIIEHGSGYMTLYGENSSLYKAVGEWVEQGEVVSAAGNSGGQSRTGIYLELRKDGQPVNPAAWFKGKPSQQQAARE
jgi:septal ring factor EnvC (AmiA/AmiB activator)